MGRSHCDLVQFDCQEFPLGDDKKANTSFRRKLFAKTEADVFVIFYMDFFSSLKSSRENMLNLNVFFTDNHHTLVENIKSELG